MRLKVDDQNFIGDQAGLATGEEAQQRIVAVLYDRLDERARSVELEIAVVIQSFDPEQLIELSAHVSRPSEVVNQRARVPRPASTLPTRCRQRRSRTRWARDGRRLAPPS